MMGRKKTHSEFVAEMRGRPIDVIGWYVNARTKIAVRCQSCGNEWEAISNNLIHGHGCPACAKRTVGLKLRKENVVLEDHDSWLLIDISTNRHPTATMAVDRDVWERFIAEVGTHVYAYLCRSTKYIYANYSYCNKSHQFHHFAIGGKPTRGKEVDHRRHGSVTYIDNRRSNLRIASRSENMRNRGLQSNNKSGVPGVSWDTRHSRWKVGININGKFLRLGRFDSFDEAVAARKQAEREYFGEFAFAAYNPA